MQASPRIFQTQNFTPALTNPVADIEAQEQPLDVFNFNDLYDLIIETENLNAQGEPLVQLIQSIEESIQHLLRLRTISQEAAHQAKQDLQSLLTFIAPNIIGEYIRSGVQRNDYNAHSRAFFNQFRPVNVARIEYIRFNERQRQAEALEEYYKDAYTFQCLAALLFYGSLIAAVALIIIGAINISHAHNAHHNRKKLHDEGAIKLAVAVPYMFFSIIFFRRASSFIYHVTDEINSYDAQNILTAEESALIAEVDILHANVRRAIDTLYLNYCSSRKPLSCFQNDKLEQPKCFYELAAKLFSEMLIIDAANGYALDNEKIIETLRVFSSSTTTECLKFNRMLNESTSDNMVICINRLLEVQIIQTSNLEWLTLRADHIFGANAAEFMHDYIDELREQMGLKPWEWPALPSALENTGSAMMSSRNPLHHPTATGVLTAVAVTFYGPRNGVPTATACSEIDEGSQSDDPQNVSARSTTPTVIHG